MTLRTGTLLLLLLLLLPAAVGGACVDRDPGTTATDQPDLGALSDGTSGMPCDATHPCAGAERCHASVCIPDNGPCATDDDCENDAYCDCGGASSDGGGSCGVCVP